MHFQMNQFQIDEEEIIVSNTSTETPGEIEIVVENEDEGMILKHIDGYATSGEMTAILGAR